MSFLLSLHALSYYKNKHLLYAIIKLFLRTGFYFFYGKLKVHQRELLKTQGPLLLTVNHPNALIDAIVIGVLFDKPIHFLTRGDAFNKSWKRKLLLRLNMIPIYRLRDGIENLHLNQFAFDKSLAVLKNNGIVLIFIEGICKHTHELQPFKKGAARIAFNCWKENIPVAIMPIVVYYSSLQKFIHRIEVKIEQPIQQHGFDFVQEEAKNYLLFNTTLQQKMNSMLQAIETNKNSNTTTNFLFVIFKMLCWPVIIPIKKIVQLQTKGTVFYHSILFAVVLVVVPIYLLLLFFFMFELFF